MESGRTKKFAINSSVALINQVVVIISGFIIPRVMLTYYGSELNGLVSSITQLIAYFSIVEAGLSNAIIYVLYKPLYRNDTIQINKIVSTAKKYYFNAGYIFTGLVVILAILYPRYIMVSGLRINEVSMLIFLLGARGFLDFFAMAKYRTLLTANQQLYIISISNLIYVILNTLIITVMATSQYSLIAVYALSLLPLFIRTIILFIFVRNKYPYISFNERADKTLISARWDALFQQVLGMVQVTGPTIIATIFLGLREVSIYTIYNIVINGINSVFSIFTSSLGSSFGNVIASDNKKILQATYHQFEYLYLQLMAIVFSTAAFMLPSFIHLYTKNITDTDYFIPGLSLLFVLSGFIYNIKTPQGMLIISAGHYRETRWRSLAQGLLLVFFSILLVYPMGLKGILIGVIFSNLYRAVDMLFYVPKYITQLSVKYSIKNYILLFLTIIGTSLIYFFVQKINIDNWVLWSIISCVIVIWSTICAFIVSMFFNKEVFSSILKRFIKLLKK